MTAPESRIQSSDPLPITRSFCCTSLSCLQTDASDFPAIVEQYRRYCRCWWCCCSSDPDRRKISSLLSWNINAASVGEFMFRWKRTMTEPACCQKGKRCFYRQERWSRQWKTSKFENRIRAEIKIEGSIQMLLNLSFLIICYMINHSNKIKP